MKHIDEFRNARACRALMERIAAQVRRPVRIMEVCGTHTHAIARSGIGSALPASIRLLSGPGCPVCVTSPGDIDAIEDLAGRPEVDVYTFGDMMRVPGSRGSLAEARAQGGCVHVCYSPTEAVEAAAAAPGRQVVFVATGFETTAPATACALRDAKGLGLGNFSAFIAHKLIPPAMEALLASGEVSIDAFLCPGHVSVIVGADSYRAIAERYGRPCVVAGFEPTDILQAIATVLEMIAEGDAGVAVQYTRAVRREGNAKARRMVDEVFEPASPHWRGLGPVPGGGLRLREAYAALDAVRRFGLDVGPGAEDPSCACGAVLRGALEPEECGAFATTCTPDRPAGPCMVSTEGACAARFRYGRAGR